MPLDLDVVVDAAAASPPFGKGVGRAGQLLEIWPIEFLEQRAAGDAKPAKQPLFVELAQHLADRRVELGQAVKAAMAQPTEQPTLDNQHGSLNLCFVAGTTRPRRQDRRVVMGRHLGIGAVDLRLVEAGLDHRDFGVVRYQRLGTPPIASKARVWAPIQSASVCVQLASAHGSGFQPARGQAPVKFEAPSTATKICAGRVLPVSRSMITGTVSPA